MRSIVRLHFVLVLLGATAPCRAEGQAAELAELPVTTEMICAKVSVNSIHGWQTARLAKVNGVLYASAAVHLEGAKPGDMMGSEPRSLFFKREANGKWVPAGKSEHRSYLWCAAPDGRFWIVGPAGYGNTRTYFLKTPLDFSSGEAVYDEGRSSYFGAGADAEGNFLLMHAASEETRAFVPNAAVAVFRDAKTGQWHKSRVETPEGRYGYEGILVRGRTALAVMNSAIADPAANPVPPHYNWRHVRLAKCDDLTRGAWESKGFLMPKFGATALQDLASGPDGQIYLSYTHRGGENSFEETEKQPMRHYIARIRPDLTAEVFATGLDAGSTRFLLGKGNAIYLAGRPAPGKNFRLWRLDPQKGFKPVQELELPGTDKLEGYVVHTLRPERIGGEADPDAAHLVGTKNVYGADGKTVLHAELWHASFALPVKP